MPGTYTLSLAADRLPPQDARAQGRGGLGERAQIELEPAVQADARHRASWRRESKRRRRRRASPAPSVARRSPADHQCRSTSASGRDRRALTLGDDHRDHGDLGQHGTFTGCRSLHRRARGRAGQRQEPRPRHRRDARRHCGARRRLHRVLVPRQVQAGKAKRQPADPCRARRGPRSTSMSVGPIRCRRRLCRGIVLGVPHGRIPSDPHQGVPPMQQPADGARMVAGERCTSSRSQRARRRHGAGRRVRRGSRSACSAACCSASAPATTARSPHRRRAITSSRSIRPSSSWCRYRPQPTPAGAGRARCGIGRAVRLRRRIGGCGICAGDRRWLRAGATAGSAAPQGSQGHADARDRAGSRREDREDSVDGNRYRRPGRSTEIDLGTDDEEGRHDRRQGSGLPDSRAEGHRRRQRHELKLEMSQARGGASRAERTAAETGGRHQAGEGAGPAT